MTTNTTTNAMAEGANVQINPKAPETTASACCHENTDATWTITKVYKNGTAKVACTACAATQTVEMKWLRAPETHDEREARRATEIAKAIEYATREIAAATAKPTTEVQTLIGELTSAQAKGPGEVAYWLEWKSYRLAIAVQKQILVARYYKQAVEEFMANATPEGLDALAAKVDEIEAEILKAEVLQTISDGQSTSKSDSIATDAKLVAAKEILDGGSTSSMRWAIRGTRGWVNSAKTAW
jgi:hypothetical protein